MSEDLKLHFKLTYPVNSPKDYSLTTNIKAEKLVDIFEEFIRSQAGLGHDDNEVITRDVYNIQIELDLRDDSFKISSDTGNANLTLGIVMDVFNRLNREL